MKRSVKFVTHATPIIIGLVLILTLSLSARPTMAPPNGSAPSGGDDGPNLFPPLVTIDQVVHNQGNIVTTVDNWGYIGGYGYYGLPSGQFPRNSGHDYIGEIRYWMGGIAPNGDTLVANSYDDFMGLPSLVTGQEETTILLSTDTTRYYDYNTSDTTGLGQGNPAHGWRIWDNATDAWVYTQNYNSIDATFFEGGPLSLQESHYRFNDASLGTPLMGLEMTHTILQWNYCYNEDFLFVILEIENTSAIDYTDFAVGLYIDIDVGGPDGTGENGRLGDVVSFDSTGNLAWTYDESGWDPGWKSNTGIMGTKYLETPQDIGMTAFRTGDWALVPDNDADRYALINSTEFNTSLPPTDQYYIQCTRGIDLTAGTTVRVVYALIAGEDEVDFQANATLAQNLYDNYFIGPEPPNTPTLSVSASDQKVYLSWNDTAQVTIDPLSGENDFSGYKLYRSDDRGRTWADTAYYTGNSCLEYDWDPVADYTISDPSDPIQHSYIDSGLVNGVEYWYALVAYDTGASATGIDPLQTGFGLPEGASHIVRVTPRPDPAGFLESAGTVSHEYNGTDFPSAGNVIPTVFDPSQMQGADYRVSFEDQPDATYWHLINETSGDTVLANQTRENEDPGMFEVAEGLRVVVRNADRVPESMTQTTLAASEATLSVPDGYFLGPLTEYFYGVTFGDQHYRSTYEFRFNGNSTAAPAFNDDVGYGMAWSVPCEVWNVTSGERVGLAVYDFGLDGAWDPWDLLIVVNAPYDGVTDPFTTAAWPYAFSWFFGFDEMLYNPSVGDVFTIDGPPLNSPEDAFVFKANGINDARARAQLAKIRVVPDPYYAHAPRWEVNPGETVIQFMNLPDECTIRIYTLSGDLVQKLEHTSGANPSGMEPWDLLSEGKRQIASGIYMYHVESPYGEKMGRFAVVK